MARESEFVSLLVDKKFLSPSEAKIMLARFPDDLFGLVQQVARNNPQRKHELGRFWGDYLGIVYLDLTRTIIQYKLLERLPEEFVRGNLIMPVYEFGGAISVVTPNPKNQTLLDQAESYLDAFVSPAFSFPDQIEDALEIGYQSKSSLTLLIEKSQITLISSADAPVSVEELQELSGESAIIEFTRGLIVLAIKQRASDIHIEPGEHTARIRFRIDGVLQEVFHLENPVIPPIVTRLKVLANADIAERRKPQDCAMKLALAERSIDLRFSSMPTIYGEKVVMRLLGWTEFQAVPELKQLGFSHDNMQSVLRTLAHPNGVFFVTGPTGSGKTTTLYAMLQHLNAIGVNIISIEDPVEYRLPGVTQVQVNPVVELSFATALRSCLRQDPDIILVGEIRDLETARIATRAAMTGHLVLTTMHTNSAIEAVTRLLDIGVEPFFVAPSIIGILAQRLVRRLCDSCRIKYRVPEEEVRRHFTGDGSEEVYFYRAKGCERCTSIGYMGRLAIHEVLLINDEVRDMINEQAPLARIRDYVVGKGHKSLRYDGMKKILQGQTTIEELDRVTVLE